ncbi:ankyrin repeat domain-containing protein 18A-like protein [Cricetulus griseus]|uniref:Ankyrin repeat domain-containing protein 18A-like protein n=1 Tax=Cricetulus griseus TaxID=10029 RepID=A0A061HWN8_CRIGR|nr:ankyrin repeat domain-containing protein 18A-like protein [Cricetulus griseus]
MAFECTHYQALILNPDRLLFRAATSLNQATLLLDAKAQTSLPHNCCLILAKTCGAREDLMDQPLPGAEHTWFTDGSSFLQDGIQKAGVEVVDGQTIIWASALLPGTSAQTAELIALTQALKMAEGRRVNIYTDSRYAFTTAHVHGEIYGRRGLLTSAGKDIKNKTEILELLQALSLPQRLSIIHCPGHQKGNDPVARGNLMADEEARKADLGPQVLSLKTSDPTLCQGFEYTDCDLETVQSLGANYDQEAKVWRYQGKIWLPQGAAKELLLQLHRWTHLGHKKLKTLLQWEKQTYYIHNLNALIQQITSTYTLCAKVNAGRLKLREGTRVRGEWPGTNWEVDFTKIRPSSFGNRTALHFACFYGHLHLVYFLLFTGSEINALDKKKCTPLMKAVQNREAQIVSVLLDQGADLNIKDYSGDSAIHQEVYSDSLDILSNLHDFGGDIEEKTKDGFTPLLLALRERKLLIAEYLITHGANIHACDEYRRKDKDVSEELKEELPGAKPQEEKTFDKIEENQDFVFKFLISYFFASIILL